jgi:hypothetical protein
MSRLQSRANDTQAAKPLTTKFVKRQPRLTKPLELRKRPRPKRRAIQRAMVTVQARDARERSSRMLRPGAVVGKLARPSPRVDRLLSLPRKGLEPGAAAEAVLGSRECKQTVDMSLEMIDIEALDTGRYQAMVIQNPRDKRSIRGFLHLALVLRSSQHAKNEHKLTADYIRHVIEAVNASTDIKTDLAGYYSFDSRMILGVPWLFIASGGDPYDLTESEAANFGVYLTVGGFSFVEPAYTHPWNAIKADGDDTPQRGELLSIREMLKQALGRVGYPYGRDWDFEDLPNSHPIYHCYFDFDGPLAPADSGGFDAHDFVRGITLDGRLVAMVETGDYEQCLRAKPWGDVDGTRFKQFVVNTVVFALTQEGSLTQQTMDSVGY